MKIPIKKIAVLGDGGWGTTLSILLAKRGYDVTLWGPFPTYIKEMRQKGENFKFLPGISFPSNLSLADNLKQTLLKSDLIIFAIPSKYAHSIIKKMRFKEINYSRKIILSVTKGLEKKSLLRISQLIKKELKNPQIAVLSGPNIASEIAQGIPSSAVIASTDIRLAKQLQVILGSPTFRIYTNKDIPGLELAGSIKNVIALACGICDGLEFGTNTKAALVTRGLSEMTKLGVALGAKEKTFIGLSGLGDLITTCFSPKSRNRTVGEAIGRGRKISDILSSMSMVAEGVETAKPIYLLSKKHKVAMPVTEEVYSILYKGKSPAKAVYDLMMRKAKSE